MVRYRTRYSSIEVQLILHHFNTTHTPYTHPSLAHTKRRAHTHFQHGTAQHSTGNTAHHGGERIFVGRLQSSGLARKRADVRVCARLRCALWVVVTGEREEGCVCLFLHRSFFLTGSPFHTDKYRLSNKVATGIHSKGRVPTQLASAERTRNMGPRYRRSVGARWPKSFQENVFLEVWPIREVFGAQRSTLTSPCAEFSSKNRPQL